MRVLDFLKDGGQIFDSLSTYPEWLTNDIQGAVQAQLIDYALRRIQPRVQLLADQLDEEVEEVVQMLVKARIDRNSYKYETLLATESFEYDPIENYNMTESESGSFDKGQEVDTTLHGHQLQRTHANSDTRTFANTDTQTLANSDTLTLNTLEGRQSAAHITGSSSSTEGARSDSTTKTVYGYNSSTGVPSESEGFSKGAQQNSATSGSDSTGSETIQRTGTETTAHAGTITDGHTGTIADAHTGTITDANSGTDTMTSGTRKDTHARSLTRSGNIGVTTSQQMIEAEREVANFSFLKILTEDLVNSFCLGVM